MQRRHRISTAGKARLTVVRLAALLIVLHGPVVGGLDAAQVAAATASAPDGWTTHAPRAEISPEFGYRPGGGREGSGRFLLAGGGRAGVHGCWVKAYPVVAGKWYRFEAWRKATGVACPRKSIFARVVWLDGGGQRVHYGEEMVKGYLTSHHPPAEPEYPADEEADASGWVRVSGVYPAPPAAKKARVELFLLNAAGGTAEWSQVALSETEAPPARQVRLAAVHFRPQRGKSSEDNCRQFVPLIEEAARQKADLVVLGEAITFVGRGVPAVEVAEPVPGPTTSFFGELARKHDLHIVLGVYERAGHLVYNTAALIGPDGKMIGKYRKVTLPTSEVDDGFTEGAEYPVFQTRFGKVGMMICYDGFFPEVARELSARGAEVIAWPVWGCNPLLARARACENHVYLVSSTFEDPSSNWMLSAVWSHTGDVLAAGERWGTVAVAEVDLSRRTLWPYLGDFRAKVARHRP